MRMRKIANSTGLVIGSLLMGGWGVSASDVLIETNTILEQPKLSPTMGSEVTFEERVRLCSDIMLSLRSQLFHKKDDDKRLSVARILQYYHSTLEHTTDLTQFMETLTNKLTEFLKGEPYDFDLNPLALFQNDEALFQRAKNGDEKAQEEVVAKMKETEQRAIYTFCCMAGDLDGDFFDKMVQEQLSKKLTPYANYGWPAVDAVLNKK